MTGVLDLHVLPLPDRGALPPGRQRVADGVIADLGRRTLRDLAAGRPNPDLLLDERSFPGVPAWMAMRKLAMALHPVYEAPGLTTLGAGLTLAQLRRPLVDGDDAFALVGRLCGPETAARALDRYATFLSTPYTDACRIVLQGLRDARAVRWRAAAATRMALAHAPAWQDPVRLVSLACGAAGPVARLADALAARGQQVERLVLVDRDPVALAAGRAIAERHVEPHQVDVRLLDLVRPRLRAATPLAPVLGAGRAHLVDILGLFEYLPDDIATDLLRRARALLRPDGVIVLGNMLDVRPGQAELSHVVRWPALVQRSVADLLRVVTAAGFGPDQVQVAVPPADDAVYTVAVLRGASSGTVLDRGADRGADAGLGAGEGNRTPTVSLGS